MNTQKWFEFHKNHAVYRYSLNGKFHGFSLFAIQETSKIRYTMEMPIWVYKYTMEIPWQNQVYRC